MLKCNVLANFQNPPTSFSRNKIVNRDDNNVVILLVIILVHE